MKRRLLKVALFLLLGAIINIAVAWWCALYVDPFAGVPRVGQSVDSNTLWIVRVRHRPGVFWLSSMCSIQLLERQISDHGESPSALVPKWLRLSRPASDPIDGPIFNFELIQANGWPFLAMWCEIASTHDLQKYQRALLRIEPFEAVETHGGIVTSLPYRQGPTNPDFRQPRVLPYRPVWLGFGVNSLSYAAMLWLLFVAPFALRRWRRRRRGCCVKCGYDLRGRGTAHERCPECGLEIGP